MSRYLQLQNKEINHIRYQLLHRTASAIISAKKFNAENALMLVHSFSRLNKGFRDFKKFISLFGMKGKVNSVTVPENVNGINLFFGWVRGNMENLKK